MTTSMRKWSKLTSTSMNWSELKTKIMAKLFGASFFTNTWSSELQVSAGNFINEAFFASRFAEEIEDIFKGPIFAQLSASCIIICMTCFLLANQVHTMAAFVSAFSYLVTMVIQVLLFCWISNELIYSVSWLNTFWWTESIFDTRYMIYEHINN